MKLNIKYPCGYELNAAYSKYGFNWDGNLEAFMTCPMHGKKCKK